MRDLRRPRLPSPTHATHTPGLFTCPPCKQAGPARGLEASAVLAGRTRPPGTFFSFPDVVDDRAARFNGIWVGAMGSPSRVCFVGKIQGVCGCI